MIEPDKEVTHVLYGEKWVEASNMFFLLAEADSTIKACLFVDGTKWEREKK